MFPAGAANKLLQWELEFSAARQPGAVNTVSGPVDIAAPDALETEQNVALQLRSNSLKFICEPDGARLAQPFYRTKRPILRGPFIRGHKLDLVASFYDPICYAFQVRLCATAPRITPANESDSEILLHSERSRSIRAHSLQSIRRHPSVL